MLQNSTLTAVDHTDYSCFLTEDSSSNSSEAPSRTAEERESAMGELQAVISCLLLTVGAATAQTTPTQISERLLPQWLTGIIAVSAFLFLVFVTMLVKKAWCEEHSRRKTSVELGSVRANDYVVTNKSTYETTLDLTRSKEYINAYNNLEIDNTGDKATPM